MSDSLRDIGNITTNRTAKVPALIDMHFNRERQKILFFPTNKATNRQIKFTSSDKCYEKTETR